MKMISIIDNIKNSSFLRLSSIYTLSNIINKAIPFFLLPIVTVYLSPEDYGIVSMFTVLIGIVTPFLGFNMHGAINRKYFERERNFSEYISTALYILTSTSIVVLLFFTLNSETISNLSSFPEKWLFLVVVAGSCNSLILTVLTLWQVRERAFKYGFFQVLQSFLNVFLSIILITLFHQGWLGRINGQVVAYILFAFIGLTIVVTREKLNFKFNWSYAKDIFKFGIPLIPHTLGAFLITMMDRVFVTNMVGVSETGIYTIGYQIGMIIGVLQDSFNNAWVPQLFKSLNQKRGDFKEKIVKITYLYFVIILILATILSLISSIIVDVFVGDNFKESVQFIGWISFGFAFNGMYKMVNGVIFYEKKTHLLSMATFLTAFLNIIFNYFFIKWNGSIGAAQATALAFFVSFIFTWVLASRVYPMPWNIFKHRKEEK